jgi:tetratricopeptide (TPR) repeat protein
VSAAALAPAPATPWLFGRWRDLLLGCGGLYTLLFALFLAAGPALRESQPALLFPIFLTFASMPHCGATLLRVYERARDRRAYALFSVWATLAIATWLVAGTLLPAAGAWLVTLYLTWSPWHYTGQNYGLAVMFLRRRGIALEGAEKRWLYASYALSFAFVFLMLHEAQPALPGSELPKGIYGLPVRPLGIPAAWNAWLQPLLLLAYLGALARSASGLLRRAPFGALLPAACLALTQALWFVLPSAVRQFGVRTPFEALDWALHDHYFTWIAAGHAVQYLWVTAFTARHSPGYQGFLPFYGKALASSAAVWMFPAIALGPAALGLRTPDAGLALLVAAAVNVHHFVLDGAIWKLRGRIAAILIRGEGDADDAAPRAPWLRRMVWSACALAVGAALFVDANEDLSRRALARGDLASAERAEARLAWIGHDRAEARLVLGRARLDEGELANAAQHAERSLALEPSLAGHVLEARALQRGGELRAAAEAWERALAFAPSRAQLHVRAAASWLAAGDLRTARAHAQRAAALAPRSREIQRQLRALRARMRAAEERS